MVKVEEAIEEAYRSAQLHFVAKIVKYGQQWIKSDAGVEYLYARLVSVARNSILAHKRLMCRFQKRLFPLCSSSFSFTMGLIESYTLVMAVLPVGFYSAPGFCGAQHHSVSQAPGAPLSRETISTLFVIVQFHNGVN